jgi:hypothetical protein
MAAAMVCGAFVISRLLAWKAGLHFLSYDEGYWQFLDRAMLTHHLAQSLFYLHIEPPLMNLMLGLWMKIPLAPPNAPQWLATLWNCLRDEAPAILYKLMGLGIELAMLALMLELGIPLVLATAVTVIYTVSPEQLLYENWTYNTFPCEFLMTFGAVCLARFLRSNRIRWGLGFLTSLALMVTLNSQYQLIFYVAMVMMLFLIEPQRFAPLRKAAVALGAALALLCLKNFVLFGVFTTSSWFGMNLSAVTVDALAPAERVQLVQAGALSRYALISPWSALENYGLQVTSRIGIPVLDQATKDNGNPNFNNLAFIALSREYAKNARWVFLHRPSAYLRKIWWTFRFSLEGASRMPLFKDNLDRLAGWSRFYRRMLLTMRTGDFQISPIFAAGIPSLWIVSGSWLYRRWRTRGELETTSLLLLMMLASILYVTGITVLLTNNDQNRMRVPVDPYYLAIATFFGWRAFGARFTAGRDHLQLTSGPSRAPSFRRHGFARHPGYKGEQTL